MISESIISHDGETQRDKIDLKSNTIFRANKLHDIGRQFVQVGSDQVDPGLQHEHPIIRCGLCCCLQVNSTNLVPPNSLRDV